MMMYQSVPPTNKSNQPRLTTSKKNNQLFVTFYLPIHFENTLHHLQQNHALYTEIYLSHADPYPHIGQLHSIEKNAKTNLLKLFASYSTGISTFYPNQFVHVRLFLKKQTYLVLPIHAIITENNSHYVHKKTDQGVIKTPVSLGQQNGRHWIILSGLDFHDEVILTASNE